jgi:hypothetical protein
LLLRAALTLKPRRCLQTSLADRLAAMHTGCSTNVLPRTRLGNGKRPVPGGIKGRDHLGPEV